MSVQSVENVLQRAREDPSFLELLRTTPDAALHGYDLSFAERTAIITGDQDRLTELGVDSNLSEMAPAVRPRRQEHV